MTNEDSSQPAPVTRTLTIKNVPDEMVDALRRRAKANHRSLQGELMTIVEAAVGTPNDDNRRG